MRRIKLRVFIEDADIVTEAQGEVDISHLFTDGKLTSIGREELLLHHFYEAKKTAEAFLGNTKVAAPQTEVEAEKTLRFLKTGRQHD